MKPKGKFKNIFLDKLKWKHSIIIFMCYSQDSTKRKGDSSHAYIKRRDSAKQTNILP